MVIFKFLLIFSATVLLVYYLMFRWRRQRLYKLAKDLPGYEKSSILKLILLFLKSRKNFSINLLELAPKNGTLIKFWLGPTLAVFTRDADFINKVFSHPDCYNKPSLGYKAIVFNKSLPFKNGYDHKRSRKIINEAFSVKTLKRLPEIYDRTSKEIVSKMDEKIGGCEFDPIDFVGAFVIDSVGRTNFNYDFNSYKTEIYDTFRRSIKLAFKTFLFMLPGFSIEFLNYFNLCQEMVLNNKKLLKIAENVVAKNKLNKSSEKTILINLLLDPVNEFEDEEIKHQILIFLLSIDTSGKTISAILTMLAIHQDVQQKIVDEINELYNQNNQIKLTVEFLKKFSYLEAVINEVMRLFPPAPIIGRTTAKEVEINGYLLPKNTVIAIYLYGMLRNERYWGKDANAFKPERFLEELEHPNSFAPFTDGRRICIGFRFAMIAMKVFIINLLRNYKINSSSKFEDIKWEMHFLMEFVNGHKVSIERRENLSDFD